MESVWLKNVRMKSRTASFTVEAVFVMCITVWVLAAVCYLSVYSHDRTVLYALAQNYLEQSVENGKEFSKTDLESGMKQYIGKHLFLCRIEKIRVEKKVMSVSAEITFYADVNIPFARKLLTGDRGRNINLSHGVLFAPNYMRDSTEIKRALK